MAKKINQTVVTGGIKKQDFSGLKNITNKYSSVAKFKDQEYFTVDEAFYEISGLPGPAKGHINMFLGHTDVGKAQILSSKILTPTGWSTMAEMKKGSIIMGVDGKKQEVLEIFPQGIRPVYKITTRDGGVTYCDEEHLWSVNEYRTRHGREGKRQPDGKRKYKTDKSFKTMSTKDMLNKQVLKQGDYTTCNYMIPTSKPMEFVEESNLLIDPYVLGCYLGDGHFATSRNYSHVEISNVDQELIDRVEKSKHCRIVHKITTYGRNPAYRISLNSETRDEIIRLGVNKKPYEKFIPNEYIYSSTIKDRIDLLHGLLDTDGCCGKYGSIEYYTSSQLLMESVCDLVRSLGGIARTRKKTPTYNYKGEKRIGRTAYTVSITLPDEIKPFYLTRKHKRLGNNRREFPIRYIKSIEYSHEEECQCILVSNSDHLYITDDYIVTHNTTGMVKSAVDAQKKGVLPVFIITEQKWSWEHAKIMGLQFDEDVDESTGEIEYSGFYIFNNNFQTIEQIAAYVNNLIDEQTKGNIPYELLFLWDSIGSVPCQMTLEGKGGKMHNAGVLADVIGMGLNQRITGSRRTDSKYTNTLVIVNQPWVKVDMKNVMSQPKIKAKGGESVYLNSTLVFQFGNQQDGGISKLDAQKNGRKILFATRSKISVIKNHINGLGYTDGRIIVTPHGFLKDDPNEIAKYKKEHSDYWDVMIGSGEFDVVDSDVKPGKTTDDE